MRQGEQANYLKRYVHFFHRENRGSFSPSNYSTIEHRRVEANG